MAHAPAFHPGDDCSIPSFRPDLPIYFRVLDDVPPHKVLSSSAVALQGRSYHHHLASIWLSSQGARVFHSLNMVGHHIQP
jgi:hypothetical protein